ncbi:MAG: hypothetical protein ACKO6E_11295, partial [Planctomycetota bacterium]
MGRSAFLQRACVGVVVLGGWAAGVGDHAAWAAPITPGNLVIYRAGSGTNSLSSTTGNDVILDERTTAGVLVQSIPITATGTGTKL